MGDAGHTGERQSVIFVPALQKRPAYRFKLIRITGFSSGPGKKIIAGLLVLPQCHGAALGVMDMIVLNNPAFRRLLSGRISRERIRIRSW